MLKAFCCLKKLVIVAAHHDREQPGELEFLDFVVDIDAVINYFSRPYKVESEFDVQEYMHHYREEFKEASRIYIRRLEALRTGDTGESGLPIYSLPAMQRRIITTSRVKKFLEDGGRKLDLRGRVLSRCILFTVVMEGQNEAVFMCNFTTRLSGVVSEYVEARDLDPKKEALLFTEDRLLDLSKTVCESKLVFNAVLRLEFRE